MDLAVIGIVVGIVATFAGAWYGAWYGVNLGIRKSIELTNKQKAETEAATRQAYLWHLQDELAVNQRIVQGMLRQLDGGPPIVEMLEPVEIAASHLQFKAWDALVQAGVLPGMAPQDQQVFRAADQAGRKAACDIQTIGAEWRRGIAWEHWTEAQKDPMAYRVPLRELLRQSQRWSKDSLTEASTRTDEALKRLKELLPANQ